MSSNQIKIEVNALKEGMFVSDLDRPWHQTPFPLQGFYIRNDDDLKSLSGYCHHVFVDVKKQKSKVTYSYHEAFNPTKKNKNLKGKGSSAKLLKLSPVVIKSPQSYGVTSSITKEVSRTGKLHSHVYEAIENVFSAVHNGAEVPVKETERVAEGMVESIARNPDALVWLAKMNDKDAYSYRHSVTASIWALVFGRHLGLNKKLLKTLAMGVLLSHIGKTKLSTELLEASADLEGDDAQAFQAYVQSGVEILKGLDYLPSGVVTIVQFHQERHNGTGFPTGVTGDRIPLLAKIAGLVDYYQELVMPRDSSKGLSPLEAVSCLFELRNITFQQDIVERFIEAVGVYPTGTLVELNSNEVGIVTGHNPERRLFPKVMVVMDEQKQSLKNGRVIDLKERNAHAEDGDLLTIADSLPKGAYNIDETEYLLTGAKSRWSWKHITGSLIAN